MRLEIPEGEFKAYLFDCDGTIADSMPIHYGAWKKALEAFGCEFPEKLFYEWGGIPTKTIVQMLNERNHLSMPAHEVDRLREEAYLELLPTVQAIPQVVAQIEAGSKHLPMAVVSGSPRESVYQTLKALGLVDHFQAIVTAEDYTHGKPSPEPFLVAAQRLGVSPEFCLVFEDAERGIEAARKAGMKWVRIPAPWERT